MRNICYLNEDDNIKVVSWELLKNSIKRQIKKKIGTGSHILQSHSGELLTFFLSKHIKGENFNVSDKHKNISDIHNDLYKIVDNWDIRKAGLLSTIYPKGIPKFVRDNNYNIELFDNGWVLIEKH